MYKRLSFQISIPCLCSACVTDKTSHSGLNTQTSSAIPAPLMKANSSGNPYVPAAVSPLVHVHSAGPSLASINHSPTASGTKTTGNDAPVFPAQAPVSTEQHESLSDVDDKKGKFKTLRQSFRVMVNHSRQRAESVNVSNSATANISVSTPKAYETYLVYSDTNFIKKSDFAECHLFPYAQCEGLVMAAQKTVTCPKSQTQVQLDTIVPELTMADLSKYNIKFSDLEIGEKIAVGGFGAVFKGKLNGSPVAIKQLIEEAHEDTTVSFLIFLYI
jgi:hypothetical protein